MTVCPDARGFRRLRRPGSSRHRASPWAAPVLPTERAGSKGSYKCCLRQRPPLVAGATTFPPLRGGTMGTQQCYQFELMTVTEKKPYNRPAGVEMHPYPRLRRYFPRRGKFALRTAFVLISISRYRTAKISPSGGDAAAGGRRGAFPTRRRRGCKGFPAADRRQSISSPRSGDTTTL